MNGASQREPIVPASLRTLAVGVAGAIVWAGVTTLAVVVYAQRTGTQTYLRNTGIVGFAAAFFVAGAVSGATTMFVYRGSRRALTMVSLLAFLSALAIFATWRVLAVTTVPNVAGFLTEWGRACTAIRTGATFGAPCGLVAALIVAAVGVLTRRRLTWRLGLAVVIILSVAKIWAIPRAIDWFAFRAMHERWHERGLGDLSTTRGAILGAASGAIAGAIVAGLVACCAGTSHRPAPSHAGSPAEKSLASRAD